LSISAVIPAYNEEKTITDVVNALKKAENIDEIIVVSDGSQDGTAVKAQLCGVKVIRLPENMGKGSAMKAGLEHSEGDIILFLDADLIGLTTEHINKLIEPVMNNRAAMAVGYSITEGFQQTFTIKFLHSFQDRELSKGPFWTLYQIWKSQDTELRWP
jgi:glycosyltransferase involved in cell wall biosynthesis